MSLALITSLTLRPPDGHPAKLRGTSQADCICDKFILQYYRLQWFLNLRYLCNIYDVTKKCEVGCKNHVSGSCVLSGIIAEKLVRNLRLSKKTGSVEYVC